MLRIAGHRTIRATLLATALIPTGLGGFRLIQEGAVEQHVVRSIPLHREGHRDEHSDDHSIRGKRVPRLAGAIA